MAQKTYRRAMNPKTGKKGIAAFKGEEGRQEFLQDSAQRKIKRESRVKLMPIREKGKGPGRTTKARKLTSLMRKGYRKGYRVKSTRGGSRR